MATLIGNNYGKARVRVSKIIREETRHIYKNLSVTVTLSGGMDAAYTAADNTPVLPTDTMKNTVYVVAARHPLDTIESFALDLTAHFLRQVDHLESAAVQVDEERWERMVFDGAFHPHAFSGGRSERRSTAVERTRADVTVESGMHSLPILKTTASGFTDFFTDEYTTLPEEEDRILGTELTARWTYKADDVAEAAINYNGLHAGIREMLLRTFADHDSKSVQHTLFAMGTAVVDHFPAVEEIFLSMPNVHNLSVDLAPFDLENRNEIFKPVDEPHGTIEGVIRAD